MKGEKKGGSGWKADRRGLGRSTIFSAGQAYDMISNYPQSTV